MHEQSRYKLRIAFFGPSLVSAYWNGSATYYRGIIRALHKRGHLITFFEPDVLNRRKHRDISEPDYAHVVIYDPTSREAVNDCLDHARMCDLVIKCSHVGAHDPWLDVAIAELSSSTRMTAYWDMDAAGSMERLRQPTHESDYRHLRKYDFVFTNGGGVQAITAYKKLGVQRCVPIYQALDPQTHHAVPSVARYESDLSFMGNRVPGREMRTEQFLFAAAEQLPKRHFVLGGSGWNYQPLPINVQTVGHVYTSDHNAFNSSALAVLNITRRCAAAAGWSPTAQMFEAVGAGACVITDEWEGLEQFFAPGEEILVARNGGEVAEHIACLDHVTAHRIGQAARQRALNQHTYAHRVVVFENTLEGDEQKYPSMTDAA